MSGTGDMSPSFTRWNLLKLSYATHFHLHKLIVRAPLQLHVAPYRHRSNLQTYRRRAPYIHRA